LVRIFTEMTEPILCRTWMLSFLKVRSALP